MYTKVLLTLVVVFTTAGVASTSHAGSTFDSDVQAKLSRFKARQKLVQSSDDERGLGFARRDSAGFGQPPGETPCGAIDLGNVKNLSGFRRPQEVTVIIDGDVINSNNHCR
ncbi:MAG: hypothetical protein ACR2RB_18615 [Gammaproteobacteria bacterium]